MTALEQFCSTVRARSSEHAKAVRILSKNGLFGQVISVLRQELDSMVRAIFLLNQSQDERNHLIEQMLNGQRWRLRNNSIVFDKTMVDLANNLQGWTQSVYKFGCAFIHLSSSHNYLSIDPFENIDESEINNIKRHLNQYHGFPLENTLSMASIAMILPMVFEKIKDNLEFYLKDLENQEVL